MALPKISNEEHLRFSINRITNIIKDKTLPDYVKVMQITTVLEKLQCKITPFLYNDSNEDNNDSNKDEEEKYFKELELTRTEVAEWIRRLIPYLENPVTLAPKGCFTDKQVVKPGAIIQYDSTLMPREPEIINQTENLKALIGLYVNLDNQSFVDSEERE